MKIVAGAILAALAVWSATKADAAIFTNLYTFSASAIANQPLAGSDGGNNP